MTSSKTTRVALAVAGINSCAMGGYHFFLPSMFHWDQFVHDTIIVWALFSINFFFSFLLLAGGVLTLNVIRRLNRSLPVDAGIVFMMGAFWLVNTIYQLVKPMPLPAKLWPLHIFLIAFALLTMLSYLAALIALRKQRYKAGQSTNPSLESL